MWYEFGEKSNQFFLNLENNRATQSLVRKVISKKQEITGLFKINNFLNFIRISFNKNKVLVKSQ